MSYLLRLLRLPLDLAALCVLAGVCLLVALCGCGPEEPAFDHEQAIPAEAREAPAWLASRLAFEREDARLRAEHAQLVADGERLQAEGARMEVEGAALASYSFTSEAGAGLFEADAPTIGVAWPAGPMVFKGCVFVHGRCVGCGVGEPPR